MRAPRTWFSALERSVQQFLPAITNAAAKLRMWR